MYLSNGYATSYTISGCSSAADCGVYTIVPAHCTDTTSLRCPGGRFANGNTDPSLCDSAPTYQSADGTRVLLRVFRDGYRDCTRWRVLGSRALDKCGFDFDDNWGDNQYLESAEWDGRVGGPPTSTSYASRSTANGDGWFDKNFQATHRGDPQPLEIQVTAGGG